MKKKKIIIIAIVIIAVIILMIVAIKKKKVEEATSTTGDNSNTSSSKFPLMRGSKGNEVRVLQSYLNYYRVNNLEMFLTVDGVFGTKTEERLYTLLGTTSISQEIYTAYIVSRTKPELIITKLQ